MASRSRCCSEWPDPEDGSSEAIALDKPVTRATYRDHYLPLIFVDRPAWGAALLNPGRVTRTRQRLRGAVPDRPARSQRQGPGRCSGAGDLRHGLLGNVRRDPVLPRLERPVGNAARLGHLGVLRQAGRRARVSGLSPAGALSRGGAADGRLAGSAPGRPARVAARTSDPAVRHGALLQRFRRSRAAAPA